MRSYKKGFTLIELLVVMAVLGVLATAVTMAINPVELLAQSRDAGRISDMDSLNKLISLYQVQNPSNSLGASSTLYISVPSNFSNCSDLGLPSLPTGWGYHCSPASNYRNVDGTGWVPIPFGSYLVGSSLSVLPSDPTNAVANGLYYTYVANGSQWELTALPESQKMKTQLQGSSQIPDYPDVIARGSNLSISPLYNTSGLIALWKFDDGSGTSAADSSAGGNTGQLVSGPVWTTGKLGGGLAFPGASRVDVNSLTSSFPSTFSISLWSNQLPLDAWRFFITKELWNSSQGWLLGSEGGGVWGLYKGGGGGLTTGDNIWSDSNWHYVVAAYDGSAAYLYADGSLIASSTLSISASTLNVTMGIRHSNDGTSFTDGGFEGTLDDVRIYNYALSPAEVKAIYNSER